jgi:hypothetical protein
VTEPTKVTTTDEAVQLAKRLITDREAVAVREAELVENLTAALATLGYRVLPAAGKRGRRPGRRRGERDSEAGREGTTKRRGRSKGGEGAGGHSAEAEIPSLR